MHEHQPELPAADERHQIDIEHAPDDRPRIYAASLGDYTNGILHGAWIDAAVEPDELLTAVQAMLDTSPTALQLGQPAEEWAIHDYDGFGPLRLGEYESSRWITAVARGIARHGPALAAWAAHAGRDEADVQRFDEVYLGEWNSLHDYAEQFLDDCGIEQQLDQLADWLRPYVQVDVGAFARDLDLGGDVTAIDRPDGGV
ncbi:MAG: antirestriction protein ArdA [Ilumatobacteraceae bacterium]